MCLFTKRPIIVRDREDKKTSPSSISSPWLKPAALNGDAYSSKEVRYNLAGPSAEPFKRLRKAGKRLLMSMSRHAPPLRNNRKISAAQSCSLPRRWQFFARHGVGDAFASCSADCTKRAEKHVPYRTPREYPSTPKA